MIQETLKRLDELEEKATPGIYTLETCARCGDYKTDLIAGDESILSSHAVGEDDYGAMEKNNAEFICALRNTYPSLRAEIERLQGEVEKLKQTSVEVERPDGSKAYVQMHCTYPHDHIVNPGSGIKVL